MQTIIKPSAAIRQNYNEISNLCKEKKTPDQLIKSVFDHYGLAMNAAQYVLVGSTIRSYASYLADGGKLKCKAAGTSRKTGRD